MVTLLNLIDKVRQKSLSIQISPELLRVRCSNGIIIETIPEVALDHHQELVAYGSAIQQLPATQQYTIVNPFKHPRACITDFETVEKLMMAVYRDVLAISSLSRPIVVINPVFPFADGVSFLEQRAFTDTALNAGAAEVYVWQSSRFLTHDEIINHSFKAEYLAQLPPPPPNVIHDPMPFPIDIAHFWHAHATRKTVYIQYRRKWLSVRCVETKTMLEGIPTIREHPHADVHPFDHPRMAINNYRDAQAVLDSWVRAVLRFQLRKPFIIIHPLEEYANDLVAIEQRALFHVLLRNNASKAAIWRGRPLTDAEIASRQFPNDGFLLDSLF